VSDIRICWALTGPPDYGVINIVRSAASNCH